MTEIATPNDATEPPVMNYRSAGSAAKHRVPFGEELPIFCEQCGYALHGLPQTRCSACQILQFHCPECGHHQPINTLRPAAKRIISRIRGTTLVAMMLFKLAYFGFLLMAWTAMGGEWSYTYSYNRGYSGYGVPGISNEMMLSFSIFGLAFGGASRLLLLRWRMGWVVGLVLAGLVVTAVFFGAWLRLHDESSVSSIVSTALLVGTSLAAGCIVVAAALAWPIWVGAVRLMLPRRAGDAMLDWQYSLSAPKGEKVADAPSIALSS